MRKNDLYSLQHASLIIMLVEPFDSLCISASRLRWRGTRRRQCCLHLLHQLNI
jgi:hypothetical protein